MKLLASLVLSATVPFATAADCVQEPRKPIAKDVHRARQTVQTGRMGGATHDEITTKINAALRESAVPMKPCADFELHELDSLVRDMHCHFNDFFDKQYHETDGRKRRFGSLAEFEASWAEEPRDPSAQEPLKHAKCAEALMLWTHHTPAAAKDSLIQEQGVTLPTLEAYNASHAAHDDPDVAQVYASSYTCQTGHGITKAGDDNSDHVWPHWPAEVYWEGAGQGPYPFWACNPCTGAVDAGNGGTIKTWWSESKAAEKFYHEVCHMTTVGYDPATSAGGPPPPPHDDGGGDDGEYPSYPCYHLMTGVLGEAKGYLYTATEDFCCISTGVTEDLAPPASDFMDAMTLVDTVQIETQFYSGEAYLYNEELAGSEAVDEFWYVTTPDGHPLQQGEGGTDMFTASGKGIFIYHDYNQTAFVETTHDASVFEVPEICKTTTNTCHFP